MDMIVQLVVGMVCSILCVSVHAASIVVLSNILHSHHLSTLEHSLITRIVRITSVTVTYLMFVHIGEVLIWSLLYHWLGAVPTWDNCIYMSFGNYTTLGFGEGLAVNHWRLLAPLEAMNGILLVGLSTAIMFAVMARVYRLTAEADPSRGRAREIVWGL